MARVCASSTTHLRLLEPAFSTSTDLPSVIRAPPSRAYCREDSPMSHLPETLERERAAAARPLSDDLARRMHAYWRAANYLSVGQIYLLDNPLLREPLRVEHTKPRLLGHWGTTPGLNFIYVHLNRIIKARGANMIYIAGPAHGGPGIRANTYLEGTYSEVYPHISQD